jgi:hypothetical protein
MSAIEMKKTNAPDPPPKTPLLTGQPYLPKKKFNKKKATCAVVTTNEC